MKRPSFHPAVWPLLVAAAFLLAACGGNKDQAGPHQGKATAVPTSLVAPAKTAAYAESPGNVVATQSARIASRLSGYVKSLNVDVGDRVKTGQLLLTIDNRDVEAQVAQARAALKQAAAVYSDAEFNYTRFTNLYKQQAASRQQYESVKRNYNTAKASVAAAKAGLAQAESQRAYAEVRAPFAGVVTARDVEQGDLATPGMPLLEVQAPGQLQVHSQISNAAYAALEVGDKVIVTTRGAHFDAIVVQLSPAADPATETHLLKAALQPDSGLSPGDFVRVLVQVGEREALMVPATAVVARAGIPAVFVVDSSGHAHLRMVRLGERRHQQVEVLSGIVAGDRIVTRPGDTVENGTLIKLEQH